MPIGKEDPFDEKREFLEEIRWEKVYSKYLEKSRDEIVVGLLKGK